MRRLLLVTAAAMVALTACGSNGDGDEKVASLNSGAQKPTADPAANKSDEDKMRDFTKCMRDHGVDMPEPDKDGHFTITGRASSDDNGMDKMNKANEACMSLLPNGGKPQPLSPEDLDKQRALAKCMRDHGVDMPDPDPENPGMTIGGPGIDKDKMDKAMKDCGINLGDRHAVAIPDGGGGK